MNTEKNNVKPNSMNNNNKNNLKLNVLQNNLSTPFSSNSSLFITPKTSNNSFSHGQLMPNLNLECGM